MKQPDWKMPFVLAFCLLALGSFAYWLQYSHKPKKDRADLQLKKPLVLPNEDAQIAQFRIKSATGVIEGKCNSLAQKTCKTTLTGDWAITYPVSVKGDSETIKDFLNSASSMVATDTIDLSDETSEKRNHLIDEYGLSDSKRTNLATEFIELTLEDGKKIAAWFGEPYPVGDKFFVGSTENGLLNEKNIFVISSVSKGIFTKGLTHFRDKSVFNFNRAEITEINAKTPTLKLDAHLENSTWTVNGKRGDYDQIETVLSSISQVKAKEFIDEAILKTSKSIITYQFKSKTNTYSLELFEKNAKPIHLPGKPEIPGEGHFYLKSSGIKEIVEVDALFRTQIDKKLNELRYATILSQTEKTTAKKLSISGKSLNPKIEFEYDGKAWVQKDKGMKLDPAKVVTLLDELSNERAIDIASPAPPAGGDALTVIIGDDKNPNKSHFLVYSVKDKNFVKDLNQTSNEALVIGPSKKNAFPFTADSWKLK